MAYPSAQSVLPSDEYLSHHTEYSFHTGSHTSGVPHRYSLNPCQLETTGNWLMIDYLLPMPPGFFLKCTGHPFRLLSLFQTFRLLHKQDSQQDHGLKHLSNMSHTRYE